MNATRVLFVDDDAIFRRSAKRLLVREGLHVDEANGVLPALRLLDSNTYDLALVDLALDASRGSRLAGLDVIGFAKTRGQPIAIAYTGLQDEDARRAAVERGAAACLPKNAFHPRELTQRLKEVLAGEAPRGSGGRADCPEPGDPLSWLAGRSAAMRSLRARLLKAARSDEPALVTGETGTGKEVVARVLHALSQRKGEFCASNVGGRADALFQSHLFGHVRGAFTGADRDRAGLFEQADGGTVLLDEIGDMPQEHQIPLLRAIQFKKVRRVGDSREVSVNARLVCATHVDLTSAVEEGRFRADLFHRICVLSFRVPNLNERREDVPLLASTFAERLGIALSHDATVWLARQDFSGNVRQLENVIRSVAVFGDARSLHDVMTAYRSVSLTSAPVATSQKLDEETVKRAYVASGGNISATARQLGVHRLRVSRMLRAR